MNDYQGLIVLAGGAGARMQAGMNKQLLQINGKTITEITLINCLGTRDWDQVVLVAAAPDYEVLSSVAKHVSHFTGCPIEVVLGGAERQDSVEKGVCALKDTIQWVWIHDGARPFVEKSLIQRIDDQRKNSRAIIPALPVKDTLKQVVEGHIQKTLDRSAIYRVQTPQCFEIELLHKMQALARTKKGFTDDASMAEALGERVLAVQGSEWNIKLTTPEDLIIGKCIYAYLEGGDVCV